MTIAAQMQGLGMGEKFLLLMLANYAGQDGTLFHSQARMAVDTSMTDRSIRTHLATLEARGLLRRTARYNRGSRTSDLIALTFIPEAVSAMAPPIPENYDRQTGKKRHLIPETISEEPVREPVSNPSRARALAPRDRAAPSANERARVGAMMRDLSAQLGKKA